MNLDNPNKNPLELAMREAIKKAAEQIAEEEMIKCQEHIRARVMSKVSEFVPIVMTHMKLAGYEQEVRITFAFTK